MNQTITARAAAAADAGSEVIAVARANGASREELSRAALRWAHDEFADSLALLSSMGDEVLVHLASDELPGIHVVFIDTGYHFAETIGTRDAYAATRPIDLIEYDAKRDKVKLNPLAEWTSADLDEYAATHGVLLNPLRDAGYESIGCAPCTRPVAEGEDSRLELAGSNKTECGLHT